MQNHIETLLNAMICPDQLCRAIISLIIITLW